MNSNVTSKAFLLLVVVSISAVFLSMISKFLLTILLAGIFSGLAHPLYERFCRLLKGRRSGASLLTLVVIVLVILVPLGLLLTVVTAQAFKVGESISPWVQDKLNHPDQIMLWLQAQPFYAKIEPFQDDILTKAGQAVGLVSGFLINSLSQATSGTVQFFFLLAIMLYTMYFFLIDGHKLLDRILYYLPLADEDEQQLLARFGSVTRATLKGTAVIGLLQGSLAGLAFAVVGIGSPVFWGTLMVVLSVIPGIGTGLIWVPAAVILAAGGHWASGIGLALFCALIVGSIDNFLRPRLVGKDTQMPDLLIFLGTLGGIMMFGVLGFIVGPIVAALFVTSWEIYGVAFKDLLPPRSQRTAIATADSDEEPGEGS